MLILPVNILPNEHRRFHSPRCQKGALHSKVAWQRDTLTLQNCSYSPLRTLLYEKPVK